MGRFILLLTAISLASPAFAKMTEITCTGAQGEYLVRYDVKAKRVVANDAEYQVVATETEAGGFAFLGTTADNALIFRLVLKPETRIEYMARGRSKHADPCGD